MSKKVVFLLDSAFNKRDYVRFGFDIIEARGYIVEAWDFSPVLRPASYQSYVPPDTVDFGGHKLFTQRQHVVDAISDLSTEDMVVCLGWPEGSSSFIFELLEEKNIPYGFCLLGLLPRASTHRQISELLHRLQSNPAVFLVKMCSRLWQAVATLAVRSRHAASPRFMITGGAAAINDRRCSALDPLNVIKAHALDYDRYLEEEAIDRINEDATAGGYALFLDDDIPYHPDYLIFDVRPYCAADKYYVELNKFFDSFEQTTGLPIIIAAHPRADYEKRGNPYGNRKLVCGKTISYTKHAKLILAHVSTSLNFAILYKKPVLFLDSLKYTMALRLWIRDTATALDQKPFIVSDTPSFRLQELTVNEELYERYKHFYIKESGTPNKMCWDIFCDYKDNW